MKTFFCSFVVALLIQFSALNSYAAEEPPQEEVRPDVIVKAGGSLVGKRRFEIEVGFQYSHNESNSLELTGITFPGLVVGVIQVQKIRRDILTPSITARFGLSDWWQVNVKIPYVYHSNDTTISIDAEGNEATESVSDNNLGDIEAGLLVNIMKEKGDRPQLYGGFKVKSDTGVDPYDLDTKIIAPGRRVSTELPTGTGHWAVEPYLTLVKTIDPAVVFFNVSYFYHIEDKQKVYDEGAGRFVTKDVYPSDSFNFSFGTAFALNDKLAISLAYEQKMYKRFRIDGNKIDNTDPTIANMLLGVSYAFSQRVSTNINVSFGLTEDSPDLQLNFNIPFRYIF